MKNLEAAIPEIESKLGYTFKDKNLLKLAFIHRSFANENKAITFHNERLEFLGDTILGTIIAEYLYHALPDLPEGELSALKARLVQASSCIAYAQHLGLSKYVLLGKGEKMNDGRGRETIISDFFEALLGAIYLDSHFEKVKDLFFLHFLGTINSLLKTAPQNWKAFLQDLCQKKFHIEPVYSVISTTGPDHKKVFVISVTLGSQEIARGEGSSIKNASQEAARLALENLKEEKNGS